MDYSVTGCRFRIAKSASTTNMTRPVKNVDSASTSFGRFYGSYICKKMHFIWYHGNGSACRYCGHSSFKFQYIVLLFCYFSDLMLKIVLPMSEIHSKALEKEAHCLV